MESMDTIRKELKEVRYYYANRKMFDQAAKDVGENEIIKTVNRYNAAVQKAPVKLYALYIGLYVGNRTQEALAQDMNFSPDYIYRQHRKLLQYLQGEIKGDSYERTNTEVFKEGGQCIPHAGLHSRTAYIDRL